MDDTDAEEFNKFIEKHWGKDALKATMIYDSDKEENTTVEPKKRGRKPLANK